MDVVELLLACDCPFVTIKNSLKNSYVGRRVKSLQGVYAAEKIKSVVLLYINTEHNELGGVRD